MSPQSSDTKTNHNAATNLLSLLEPIVEEFGQDTPLTYVLAFLRIAAAGGPVDQGSLMRQMKYSSAVMSRSIQTLGKLSWKKDEHGNKMPGLDLVESVTDPRDFRLRQLALTPKGERLLAKVSARVKEKK